MGAPVSVADGFDRANTSNGLGIAPTGGVPWTVLYGQVKISSGKAVATVGVPTCAVVDAGVADVEVGLDISQGGSEALYLRVRDAHNWWRVRLHAHPHRHPDSDYRVVIERCKNGKIEERGTTGVKRSVTYTHLRVRATGVAILAYTNISSVPFTRLSDPFLASATLHGLGRSVEDEYQGVGGMDNFTATPLDTPPSAMPLLWPTGGVSIDADVTNRFTWGFSDVDPGDHQSRAVIRYRRSGDTAWETISVAGPLLFYDFAPGDLPVGDYEWQGKSFDAHDVEGPWSESEFFTVTETPADFVLLEPFAGERLYDTVESVVWSTSAQDIAQIRSVADDGNGNPVPATVYSGPFTVTDPNQRTFELAFAHDNRAEHVQLRVLSGGLWTDWADAPVFTAFTPPLRALVNIDVNLPPSAITITSVHHKPIAGAPDVAYVNLWRRQVLDQGELTLLASQWLPGVPFSDFTVRSGVDYEFMVESVAADGALSQSSWFDATSVPNATGEAGVVEPTVTTTI